jgi:hypothetical protein
METLACITGFIAWKGFSSNRQKAFPFYLLILSLLEWFSYYQGVILHNLPLTVWIGTYITIPLQFLFFFWLYGEQHVLKGRTWLTVAAMTIFVVAMIFDAVYFRKAKWAFSTFPYLVGNLLLLVFVLRFFVHFIQGQAILAFKKDFYFWVSLGVLLFYLGSLPYFGLWNILRQHTVLFTNYWMVQMSLNCMMYGCFIVAFLCTRPK